MDNIELVIRIPEHFYENNIKKELPIYLSNDNIVAILPEGHGRVIDESKITKCEQIGLIIKDGNVTPCLKTDAPTIVKSDKKVRGLWKKK